MHSSGHGERGDGDGPRVTRLRAGCGMMPRVGVFGLTAARLRGVRAVTETHTGGYHAHAGSVHAGLSSLPFAGVACIACVRCYALPVASSGSIAEGTRDGIGANRLGSAFGAFVDGLRLCSLLLNPLRGLWPMRVYHRPQTLSRSTHAVGCWVLCVPRVGLVRRLCQPASVLRPNYFTTPGNSSPRPQSDTDTYPPADTENRGRIPTVPRFRMPGRVRFPRRGLATPTRASCSHRGKRCESSTRVRRSS